MGVPARYYRVVIGVQMEYPHPLVHFRYLKDGWWQLYFDGRRIGPPVSGYDKVPADNKWGYELIPKLRMDCIALHELFGLEWSD